MIFNCGPSASERWAARMALIKQWHPYFAWLPVRLNDNRCAWLQTVERKGTFHEDRMYLQMSYWSWNYRAMGVRNVG